MKELKIAKEVAEVEYDRFLEQMDLLIDPNDMELEDKSNYQKTRARIIRAICRGHLVINDDGEAVYTPQHPKSVYKEPITFHERSGASVVVMDGKKKDHDISKGYAAMAEMCRIQPKNFATMVGEDIKICEAIFALLMD